MGTKYSSQINIGDEFRSWTISGKPFLDDKGRAKVEVTCECGNTVIAEVYNLVKGRSSKCRTCAGHGSPIVERGTPAGDVPAGYITRVRATAASRGLVNSLTPTYLSESFSNVQNTCTLSGLSISFTAKNASLDRVDSDEGYTEENTQWVHKAINEMKGNLPNDVFIGMCHQVASHNAKPENVDFSPIEKTAAQRGRGTLTDFFDRRENQ